MSNYHCPVRTYAGSRTDPEEYCDEPVDEAGDLCARHEAIEEAQARAEDAAWDEWKERHLA